MYDNTFSMAVTFLATMFLLIYIAKPNQSPIKIVLYTLKKLFTNYQFLLTVIFMFGILFINKIELSVENNLKDFIIWDFTYIIHGLEGDIVSYIQRLTIYPLTYFLTYMYVFTFPALIWSSLAIYRYYEDEQMIKSLFFGFILNYLIAIPFYLFIPVNESWFANPHVSFLIKDIYPAFTQQYRPLSGLNNCFPSLHTSISMTVALIAQRSKHRNLAKLSITCATLIAFATLYLGIHWFLDVTGGLILAILIAKLSLRYGETGFMLPEPRLVLKVRLLERAKQYITLIINSIFKTEKTEIND